MEDMLLKKSANSNDDEPQAAPLSQEQLRSLVMTFLNLLSTSKPPAPQDYAESHELKEED
jgi:hypothetical protein